MPNIIEIDDPHEAIRYLRATELHWQKVLVNLPFGSWVFRGQGNAEWPLLPSLHRKQKINSIEGLPEKASAEEFYKVKQFVELADSYGLIKGREFDLGYYQQALIKKRLGEIEKNPEVSGTILEALMLAQHHGVATRILDWSASPIIALYFAAESSVKDRNSGTHFSVWCLQREHYTKDRLLLFPAIRSQNSNALSQQGHFTIDLQADENFTSAGWQSHDAIIDEKWDNGGHGFPIDFHYMKKLVFPKEIALEILWLLSLESVTKLHIMTSLDSVNETMNLQNRYSEIRAKHSVKVIEELNSRRTGDTKE